jgi:anthranilate synthase component 1
MPQRETRRRLDIPPATLRRLVGERPDLFPVLFDSAAAGSRSVLAAMPCGLLGLDREGRLVVEGDVPAAVGAPGRSGGFLAALDEWWRSVHVEAPDGGGVAGGWVVYLGYEMAQEIEPRLRLPRGSLPWRALALRVRGAVEHDLASGAIEAVVAPGSEALLPGIEALARLAAVGAPPAAAGPGATKAITVEEEPPERFIERVAQAQEHIRAGDIYQANLSRWWRAPWPGSDAYALYERLCAANPAPFAAFARLRGMDILSSSPERLIQLVAREASTRPIAGTRPRSRLPGEDSTEAAALAAHPKERAEHVMLIDLERNDLGRICKAGSVRVDEFMVVESYAHVHHIVSNVRGTLRDDVTVVDALRAVFPGGTITGVPKVRCMEIIAALEGAGRDAYTGSLGWIAANGDADFNILIRTLTLADGRLEARAGAGIVADSEAARELDETRAKARGLLAALVDS